jgi:hypothetical protein
MEHRRNNEYTFEKSPGSLNIPVRSDSEGCLGHHEQTEISSEYLIGITACQDELKKTFFSSRIMPRSFAAIKKLDFIFSL